MTPEPGHYNILSAVEKPLHRFKRRVISQGFSDDSWSQFEPSLQNHVDRFVEIVSEGAESKYNGWSDAKDMNPISNTFMTTSSNIY